MKIPASGSLTGRAVEEWVGRTADSKPPSYVMDRLLLRQDGKCALSGIKIKPGDALACDHIVPLKDGGANAERNLQMVLSIAHAEKTADENAARTKERRIRMKHLGIYPKTKTPLRSRGFAKSRPDYDRTPDT